MTGIWILALLFLVLCVVACAHVSGRWAREEEKRECIYTAPIFHEESREVVTVTALTKIPNEFLVNDPCRAVMELKYELGEAVWRYANVRRIYDPIELMAQFQADLKIVDMGNLNPFCRKEKLTMNWKYEAIDKLKQYEAKKKALVSIPAEISRLELAMKSIRSATADGTAVQGGGSGREDMLLSNIVHRQELAGALEQAKKWVAAVEGGLAVLGADERLILDRFYINPAPGNVDKLCGELGVEKSSVYRRRESALHHFTVCLYGCAES